MGIKFGYLNAVVRGRVTYGLSPFEQRAFGGALYKGLPNMARRFFGKVFMISPVFVTFYMIHAWGDAENLRLSRHEAKYQG